MLLNVIFLLCLPSLNISSVLFIFYILSYILRFLGEKCINHICDILKDPSYFPSKEYLNVSYDPNVLCNLNYTISLYIMLVEFIFKMFNMFFIKIIYFSLAVITGHNSKILCRYIMIFHFYFQFQ